jgi:hypothetical protein
VVAAAKEGRPRAAIEDAIGSLESSRPAGTRPDEIEAMPAAVPDLSPALRTATPEALADIFDAFNVIPRPQLPLRRVRDLP